MRAGTLAPTHTPGWPVALADFHSWPHAANFVPGIGAGRPPEAAAETGSFASGFRPMKVAGASSRRAADSRVPTVPLDGRNRLCATGSATGEMPGIPRFSAARGQNPGAPATPRWRVCIAHAGIPRPNNALTLIGRSSASPSDQSERAAASCLAYWTSCSRVSGRSSRRNAASWPNDQTTSLSGASSTERNRRSVAKR